MSDLISRQAAIELCDWYRQEYSEVKSYFQKFHEELKELPSAQPTLYGYNLDYLIAFAIACERAEVSNEDLKEFANEEE